MYVMLSLLLIHGSVLTDVLLVDTFGGAVTPFEFRVTEACLSAVVTVLSHELLELRPKLVHVSIWGLGDHYASIKTTLIFACMSCCLAFGEGSLDPRCFYSGKVEAC